MTKLYKQLCQGPAERDFAGDAVDKSGDVAGKHSD